MATRRGPRFKECRRLGVNVCGHPKALNRANDPAFKRTHKISEYGQQLIEKQKVKAYYGILEKQLVRYFKAAAKSAENTGAALITSLECRLDNLVYRIGFANSIRMARQIVNHGHILVDSFLCYKGGTGNFSLRKIAEKRTVQELLLRFK